MAMSILDSGPKLDWTRDNQIFLRYKKWKARIEFILQICFITGYTRRKNSLPQVLDG